MNKIVSYRIRLDIPEAVVERLVGREDDGSDAWHEDAWDAVEEAVKDDPNAYLEHAISEEVEVEA